MSNKQIQSVSEMKTNAQNQPRQVTEICVNINYDTFPRTLHEWRDGNRNRKRTHTATSDHSRTNKHEIQGL